jgi:hypothetical protein
MQMQYLPRSMQVDLLTKTWAHEYNEGNVIMHVKVSSPHEILPVALLQQTLKEQVGEDKATFCIMYVGMPGQIAQEFACLWSVCWIVLISFEARLVHVSKNLQTTKGHFPTLSKGTSLLCHIDTRCHYESVWNILVNPL